MAGFLPNVPGVRIPYHRDGSLVKYVTTSGSATYTPSGSWTTTSASVVTEMNDGDTVCSHLYTATSTNGGMYAIVFPQTVTITGCNFITTGTNKGITHLLWSTDTVDGTDGTWNTESIDNSFSSGGTHTPIVMRTITATNLVGVKGVRVAGYQAIGSTQTANIEAQLYGQWTPATLAAWHPTLDQQINGHELDFGDVILGNAYNKQFRIKNGNSLIANNVVISCTSGTAEFISGLTFSLDGTNFSSSVTIPSIAAGAISGTVYVRRTVSAGQSANILAMAPIDFIATSWT